jgi:nitroreductase
VLPRSRVIAMLDVFRQRHAIRSFQPRQLKEDDLTAILAAANSAPSAGGLSAWEISVVTNPAIKRRLAVAAYGQNFVAEAPIVFVFWAVPPRSAAKYGERGRNLFALQDATIAAAFAWLQAVASGLGGCWVGAFDDSAVKDVFRDDIEPAWLPVVLLPVGYAAE